MYIVHVLSVESVQIQCREMSGSQTYISDCY